jgi:uncharacterized protein YqgV (UPF0045/DUF77 family)
MAELLQQEKQAIIYDALPHYYIKTTTDANKTSLEMPLEELLSYALNIEEAAVNTGHDAEGNSNYSNKKNEEHNSKNRDVKKANITRKVLETSPHQLWHMLSATETTIYLNVKNLTWRQ